MATELGQGEPTTLEPRSAPAGAAIDWLQAGWQAFLAAPALWVGIWFVFMAIMIVIGLLPVVGVAGGALVPILAGGVMRGAQAQRDFNALRFDHLFEGFSHHLYQLAILGAIYLGATIALGLALLVAMIGAGGVLGEAGLARISD